MLCSLLERIFSLQLFLLLILHMVVKINIHRCIGKDARVCYLRKKKQNKKTNKHKIFIQVFFCSLLHSFHLIIFINDQLQIFVATVYRIQMQQGARMFQWYFQPFFNQAELQLFLICNREVFLTNLRAVEMHQMWKER